MLTIRPVSRSSGVQNPTTPSAVSGAPSSESKSSAAVEELGRHQGELHLGGVRTVTTAAARSLATHEGVVLLDALKGAPEEAIEFLAANRDVKLPRALRPRLQVAP
jgi:hypothetical protein